MEIDATFTYTIVTIHRLVVSPDKVCSSFTCPDGYSAVAGDTVCKDSECTKDKCCEKKGKPAITYGPVTLYTHVWTSHI